MPPMFFPKTRAFTQPPLDTSEQTWRISGVTRDSAGAVLGSVTVYLFLMVPDVQLNPTYVGCVVSDASGNYSFTVAKGSLYWVTTYKAGVPDVAGASVNTLVGI